MNVTFQPSCTSTIFAVFFLDNNIGVNLLSGGEALGLHHFKSSTETLGHFVLF